MKRKTLHPHHFKLVDSFSNLYYGSTAATYGSPPWQTETMGDAVTYLILWQSEQAALGVSSKHDRILVWIDCNKPPITIPASAETLRELKEVIQPAIEAFLRTTTNHQFEVTMSQLSFCIDMVNRTVTHNRAIPNPSHPSDHEVAAVYDELITLLQSFAERYRE